MTVQLDVPTGAELRAHVERWKALPEGERPRYPIERWLPYDQRWEGRLPQAVIVEVHRVPNDDTPQPGLRLVPLPVPVGDGWRRPVDEAEARAAGRWGDGVMEVMSDLRPDWSSGGVLDPVRGDVRYRVPASWEPGRERVEVGKHRGRTIGGKSIYGIHPAPSPPRLVLDDPGSSTVVATVIGGTAWVWVDPIEAPEPEPWVPQAGDLVRCERRSLPKRVVHVHEGRAWIDEGEWWHQVVPLSSLRPLTERDGE